MLFWISQRLRWPRWIPRCLHFRLAIASGTCCWGTRHFRTMTGNVNKTCVLCYQSCWLRIILKVFVFVCGHIFVLKELLGFKRFIFYFTAGWQLISYNFLRNFLYCLPGYVIVNGISWVEVLCDDNLADLNVVFDPGLFGFTLLCPSVSNEWNLPGFFWVSHLKKRQRVRRIMGKVPYR